MVGGESAANAPPSKTGIGAAPEHGDGKPAASARPKRVASVRCIEHGGSKPEMKSANPLLTSRTMNAGITSAKRTIDAFMDAVVIELAHEKQNLAAYLMSYDTEKKGSIPIDVAARILTKISLKWTQRTPSGRPALERALRTLNVFDETVHPQGEISIKHLYHACTTNHRTRRVLGGSIMRRARSAMKRDSQLMEWHPVLMQMERGYMKRPASGMDSEDFYRFLAAILPSLQPYEISMCWEVHVQNGIEGKKEAKAPSAGNFSFTLTQISVSWSFRTALTFCIVLNAVSMMLDDPLCDPVDSNGSTLCIFNCAEVVSSIDGHPCDTTLEIVRQQLEFFLLVIFTTEMGILLVTMSFRYFLDTWNQIDFVVISLSWVTVFVDGPSITAVRLVKLLRLLRAFKGYKKMQVIAERRNVRARCALKTCSCAGGDRSDHSIGKRVEARFGDRLHLLPSVWYSWHGPV